MKSIVAALLSALLCMQPVCAMPVHAMPERKPILYEDTQKSTQENTQKKTGGQSEDTRENTDEQNDDTQENADEQNEDTQEDTGGQNEEQQEDMDTQGEIEASGEDSEGEKQEEAGALDGAAGQDPGNAAGSMTVSAPSAILMETSTGQVIFEKDADTQRPPASVTKVMTLLLIFDALDDGKIKLEDQVTTSEYAASMGGSQVFLEPGEVQTVDTMIKCISVASANDACAAFKNSRRCTNEGKSAILYIRKKTDDVTSDIGKAL